MLARTARRRPMYLRDALMSLAAAVLCATAAHSAAAAEAVAIAAGSSHTCLISTGGGVECWGLNSAGQLGDPSFQSYFSAVPRPVSGFSSGVSSLSLGDAHSCALTAAGAAK